MTIFFAGQELEHFEPHGTSVYGVGDQAQNGSRGSVRVDNDGSYMLGYITTDGDRTKINLPDSWWLHYAVAIDQGSNGSSNVEVWDTTGQAWVRMRSVGGRYGRFDYWDGSAWQNLATYDIAFGGFESIHWDWHVVRDATVGKIEVFRYGLLVASFYGDTTFLPTTLNRFMFKTANNYQAWFSHVISATFPTINARIRTLQPTGNGNYNDFTNDYTAVDEGPNCDTSDFISGATATNKESYTHNALATSTGYVLRAVMVGSFHKHDDSGGPQNMRHFLRINGTDYPGPSLTIGNGFTPDSTLWALDPSTSAAWGYPNLNAAEMGVEAQA